ncbi:hypothetical protein [Thermovibrio ammonificans]|uniref:hypothetical protein n=1 Tax=Thermovibrio ammonificans TaxID=228745 RepID=UPI003CCCDB21
MERVPLTKDSGILLLRCRGRLLLLHYGPSGATLLKEWGDEEGGVPYCDSLSPSGAGSNPQRADGEAG